MAEQFLETILIVDDEEPVRRTFADWLTGSGLECQLLVAPDAETALQLANKNTIDLAILDWALGAGDDGLQLLQDLYAFHPDLVAIMITGYANQATPLDAMRMGVRDYLDKNSDLSRESFLKAVRKQLDVIRPAKRARQLHEGLVGFRDAVAKIIPLVESTTALNDPVPPSDAVRGLVRFLIGVTGAAGGVLLVRHFDSTREPAEICRVYDDDGQALQVDLVPFAHSIAGTAFSMQEPCAMADLDKSRAELQPFERGRRNLLAVPIAVSTGLQAVIELFDKKDRPFSGEDQRLAKAAAALGAEMLGQALGQRQSRQVLMSAVEAALEASERMARTLEKTPASRPEEPPPAQVIEQIRRGLVDSGQDSAGAEQSLRLAEAIRVLALRHGPPALEHCLTLVREVGVLLDKATT